MKTAAHCAVCGKAMDCPMVCPACGALGSPAHDHYAALGIERRLDLDPADLRRRYLDLSRRLHPDRQDAGDEPARRRAEELTAELNKAYKTLSNPEARAADWLARHGVALREEKGALDPELAERSLEIQEAIEAAGERKGDGEMKSGSLADLRTEVGEVLAAAKAGLEGLFQNSDPGDPKALEGLKKALVRYRFIERQARNLDQALGGAQPLPRAAGAES